jgi:hypothetical protein
VSFQISHYDYRIKSTSVQQQPKGKRGNYLQVEDKWFTISPFDFLIIDESIQRALRQLINYTSYFSLTYSLYYVITKWPFAKTSLNQPSEKRPLNVFNL